MKPILVCLMVLFSAALVFGQTRVDACAVMQNPEKYANTVIELKGIVHSSFEEFAISGSECEKLRYLKIWLAYPDQPEVKDDKSLRAETMSFRPSSASKKFDKLLNKKCGDVRVSATLRGFFQYRKETVTHSPDGSTAIVGFGHQGMYSYRLVILSVESAERLPCVPLPAA